MSILIVGSTNPDFSFVISKNPATIRDSKKPYHKEIRQGVAYGWFNEQASEFKLWFKDHPLKSSFAEGARAEFEYLDRTRYASPYLPISLITNCLASAFKQQEVQDVVGFKHYLETTVEVNSPSMLNHLTQHVKGVNVTFDLISGRAYKVRMETEVSVHHLLNAAMVVFLMLCVTTRDLYINLKGDIILKYINSLNKIDAPYFLRYLFKRNIFTNRGTFEKNKMLLDTKEIKLTHGDTQVQRMDAIFPHLKGGETLIDIGTGEGNYTLKQASKYEHVFAYDADEEVRENAEAKFRGRQVENVTVGGEVTPEYIEENASLFNGADVLMVEVLEHMPLEKAAHLLDAVLKTDFRTLVFTTPNKDFNKYYLLGETEFRHDDHKWEMNSTQFAGWVTKHVAKNSMPNTDFSYFTQGIGDSVDGVFTSVMAVVTNNNQG